MITTAPEWLYSLEQGSDAWLALRRQHLTSTDAAALLGRAKFSPKNPAEIWTFKRTAARPFVNWQMRLGTEMEAEERAALEAHLGEVLRPACVIRQIDGVPFMASLDGADLDQTVLGEVKTCGGDTDTWKWVCENDIPPPWYGPQVQHAMMTSGVFRCVMNFRNRDSQERRFIEVKPDDLVQQIIDAGKAFWPAMALETNPFITEGRADAEWIAAATRYREAKAAFDLAEAEKDVAAKLLQELSGKKDATGYGVAVKWAERNGGIDYAKLPQLQGVDLEPYRKKPTQYATIKIIEDKD